MTSNNICKVGEFKDAIFYEAICSCQADNHSQTLIVEADEDICGQVNLQIYSKIITPQFISWNTNYEYSEAMQNGDYFKMAFYKAKMIIEHIWAKIRLTRNIWLKGYVEAENQFIFRNEASIDDYIEAITQAKIKIKENKK